VELPGRHLDGREIPLEITFGVFERQGRHFFTGIMRDASDRRRVEEDRRIVLEREREARASAEQARREAESRARQEQALREAAAAVASGFTVEDTAQRIASSSLDATQAEGAFVQQLDAASQEIVVVAAEGRGVPPVGRRVSFEGSLTQQAIERGSPLLLGRLDDTSLRVRHELPDGCGGCSAAVIPLRVDEQAVGSLILLRERGRAFDDDDSARAGIFGELASLAFHKIQLLADVERRHEELRRVVESRALLVRGFSHDVKNPIGAADGYLQLLQEDVYDGRLDDAQRAAVGRARRALGSALTLIRDLLELARAEAGPIEIRPTEMDVGEAIEETVLEYRAQAERAGLEMSVEPPEPLPTIVSDPTRVRQIVGNILSNAVKYTDPPGRIAVCIVASERGPAPDPDGWIGVQVSDTGGGIPEEERERLFEEFFRLEPNGSEGAGIGLAISRRLAHALGGDITVKSEVGAGSTFTLWLPRTARDGVPERPD
jgi:signal transduction histidine kinase